MARLPVALLLLASLAISAGAARSWSFDLIESTIRGADTPKWLPRGSGSSSSLDRREEKSPAIVAIKYEVSPSQHDDFISAWRKLEKKTRDEKGNILYDLKKTYNDNLYFWTYGEWESYHDYVDHFKSGYTEDFLEFLDDKDIEWELYPLKNFTDTTKESRHHNNVDRKRRDSDDPRDNDAHVIFSYHVPPSKVDEFIERWNDAAEKTWDEEDNIIYALRKIATVNHHFVGYGTWKSYDAYLDHFLSGHTRKLIDFFADSEIIWRSEALKKIGDEREE